MGASFQSAYTFFKKVDTLRTGPEWCYHTFETEGDLMDENKNPLKEQHEVWYRDPVECIAELLSNPTFNSSIKYRPERVYSDKARKTRVYDEMWTADWWWKVQVSLNPIC
jgi:hypothetical protein